eukprot:1355366-Pleurochrysis_carterae.AAC.2
MGAGYLALQPGNAGVQAACGQDIGCCARRGKERSVSDGGSRAVAWSQLRATQGWRGMRVGTRVDTVGVWVPTCDECFRKHVNAMGTGCSLCAHADQYSFGDHKHEG